MPAYCWSRQTAQLQLKLIDLTKDTLQLAALCDSNYNVSCVESDWKKFNSQPALRIQQHQNVGQIFA